MPEKEKTEPDDDEFDPPPKRENCGSDDVVPMLHGPPIPDAWEEYVRCEKEHRKPPFIPGSCCLTEHDPHAALP